MFFHEETLDETLQFNFDIILYRQMQIVSDLYFREASQITSYK